MSQQNTPPLVVHIIHRLQHGGLENGLVNLINGLPSTQFQHAIICLTDYTDFAKRIKDPNVQLITLHKKQGKDIGLYFRLWKALRQLHPSIVHTRNLAAIEGSVVAFFAGVPIRIHGEHGRDIYDVDGSNTKYQKLRRFCDPFIHRFIALSKDLQQWLINDVGIKSNKIDQLYNGVSLDKFSIETSDDADYFRERFGDDVTIIGTVGRMEAIKDQLTLVKAFITLLGRNSEYRKKLRLVMIGDGQLKTDVMRLVAEANIVDLVWIPGSRDDIPKLMRAFDIFVLPSLGEGISNTILEAMASGLPVVATRVGGNPELVVDGETGLLVDANRPDEMADAIDYYVQNPNERREHGTRGRARVESTFSMPAMLNAYATIYQRALAKKK